MPQVGRLSRDRETEVQLIKAWPDLTSVRKRDSGTRWLPFAPDYPLIRPYRPKRKPRAAPAEPLQLALPLADGRNDGACTPKPQQSAAERRPGPSMGSGSLAPSPSHAGSNHSGATIWNCCGCCWHWAAPDFPFVSRELTDTLRMADALGVDLSRRRFQTRARIREVDDDLARDNVRLNDPKLTGFRFLRPPIPGTADIVPLRAPRAPIEEGRQQDNCVATYAERVAAGDTFTYPVLRPERATLSIVRMSGGWHVGELQCGHNQPVSNGTQCAVETWLDGYRL